MTCTHFYHVLSLEEQMDIFIGVKTVVPYMYVHTYRIVLSCPCELIIKTYGTQLYMYIPVDQLQAAPVQVTFLVHGPTLRGAPSSQGDITPSQPYKAIAKTFANM